MIVEVLAVGTELLLGQIVNSNAAEIGQRLAEGGLEHYRQTVVGDNLDRVAAAIAEAAGRADAVIITGGIGPTQDDLTREALCIAAGVEMAFSESYAEELRSWWERRGREMPESNLRQAQHPEGAQLLANPKGTAPGLALDIGSSRVFALPGVPQEMLPMLTTHVLPTLAAAVGGEQGTLVSRVLRTWGESESRISEILDDLFEKAENPTLAFLASGGEIKIRLTAWAADESSAAKLIDPVAGLVIDRLGSLVFSSDGATIEEVVLDALRQRHWTVATAESATGGMVAARLTSLPGSSDVTLGGIVAYDRAAKESVLSVPAAVVDESGLVSEEVAIAMAAGAANVMGADVAVAVTGAAGPDPLGTEGRPGTMVIAVRTPERTMARTLFLPGDRERVRTYATTAALHHLRLAVTGVWWS